MLSGKLRTSKEDVDTVIWLALQQPTEKLVSGNFYFDRAETPRHLPFVATTEKNGEVSLREEDVVVSNVRMDLTRGRHNSQERNTAVRVEMISEAFDTFQLMTYGIKCPVHATKRNKKNI
ncbi:hypothetical protein OROMI_024220 [Orobanche minor]